MAKKPEQFFHQPRRVTAAPQLPSTSIAVYELRRKDKTVTIAVECAEAGSNVPQNAASVKDVVRKLDLGEELDAVSAMAEAMLEKLKILKPGEVEIEFGVELGGELGFPMVTKGEARANFKVTLKWSGKERALENEQA